MLLKSILIHLKTIAIVAGVLLALLSAVPMTGYADPCTVKVDDVVAEHCCGSDTSKQTAVSIDLGCNSQGGPILDVSFALIRFLSIGVGLIIVGSLVYAGLQYIGSRGDPSSTAQAVKRIQANVTALLLFVFAFAIINYVVPGKLLR